LGSEGAASEPVSVLSEEVADLVVAVSFVLVLLFGAAVLLSDSPQATEHVVIRVRRKITSRLFIF
jgi:hypothetical protein